jgi:hypothetical protein
METRNYSVFNAIVYDVLSSLSESYSSLHSNRWVKMIMAHCLPDWVLWKTDNTMKDVDEQTEEIKEQWQREDNEAIVKKFQDAYPEAKVTTYDEVTGAVFIEHPPDGSVAQKLLGGTIEIRSPWSLPEK